MITLAKNSGFCFGVRRATKTVEELIKSKSEGDVICTLGKLIHNEQYNKFLEENGVTVLNPEDIDSMIERAKNGEKITVVIRTHGIEYEIQEKLKRGAEESENLRLIDCTCPYVKAIHKIAAENSGKEEAFLLIGHSEHPEVKSIMSYVNNNGYVFGNAKELEDFIKSHNLENLRVNVAAQTTQKLTEWKKTEEIIKKYFTNSKLFSTICRVTDDRQTEAEEISRVCDAMVVIGGRESSNTSKLVQVCEKHCSNTYWIETADELPLDKIRTEKNIGITAGASTPDSIIQEVKEIMENMNENFAQMLEEEYAKKAKIYVGATVTGIVMAISENEISLDLGDKLTGVITRDQITDSNDVKLSEMFKIGDEVTASVVSKSDVDGIATLSKKKVDAVKNREKLVAYAESKEVVSAKITKANKGGLVASIDGVEVFIPASMTGVKQGGSFEELVGTTQEVKVMEVKEDKKNPVASIRAVLSEKRAAAKEEFWSSIEEGKVYEAPVKSITSYGAFVDLGIVDGLVHRSELTWEKNKEPSSVVKVGDVIKVFVKSFDREKGKVSLSCKTEDTNPWLIFKNTYNEGDVASVKIVNIETFGAFAEIVNGVDGLIHISQIADRKIDAVANVLKKGDVVDALITAIDDEKQKVSLSMRALLEGEEATEEAVEKAAEATEDVAEAADDAE